MTTTTDLEARYADLEAREALAALGVPWTDPENGKLYAYPDTLERTGQLIAAYVNVYWALRSANYVRPAALAFIARTYGTAHGLAVRAITATPDELDALAATAADLDAAAFDSIRANA